MEYMAFDEYDNNVIDTTCLETLLSALRDSEVESIIVYGTGRPKHIVDFINDNFDISFSFSSSNNVLVNNLPPSIFVTNVALRLYKDWLDYFPENINNAFTMDDLFVYTINNYIQQQQKFFVTTRTVTTKIHINIYTRVILMLIYLFDIKANNKTLAVCSSCNGIFSAMEQHTEDTYKRKITQSFLEKYKDKLCIPIEDIVIP